jgi:four helix bundle protein
MDLVLTTYSLAAKLPQTERFTLGAQLRRSAISIPSNIAEGHAGGPRRRYLHHVRIAVGSLAELDTQLELARRLQFLTLDDVRVVGLQLTLTGQLLHALAHALRKAPASDSR